MRLFPPHAVVIPLGQHAAKVFRGVSARQNRSSGLSATLSFMLPELSILLTVQFNCLETQQS
jgi:hypothetical protein